MRIQIDLNRRAADGTTVTDLQDAERPADLNVGDTVTVFEPEDGIRGFATVQSVDRDAEQIYLNVDWQSFEDDLDPVAEWTLESELTNGWRVRVHVTSAWSPETPEPDPWQVPLQWTEETQGTLLYRSELQPA